jgi:hypothetical protein
LSQKHDRVFVTRVAPRFRRKELEPLPRLRLPRAHEATAGSG